MCFVFFLRLNINTFSCVSSTVPPTGVEIVGHAPDAVINVKAGDSLTLECLIRDSKPVSTVTWYRGHEPLRLGKYKEEEEEEEEEGKRIEISNIYRYKGRKVESGRSKRKERRKNETWKRGKRR